MASAVFSGHLMGEWILITLVTVAYHGKFVGLHDVFQRRAKTTCDSSFAE